MNLVRIYKPNLVRIYKPNLQRDPRIAHGRLVFEANGLVRGVSLLVEVGGHPDKEIEDEHGRHPAKKGTHRELLNDTFRATVGKFAVSCVEHLHAAALVAPAAPRRPQADLAVFRFSANFRGTIIDGGAVEVGGNVDARALDRAPFAGEAHVYARVAVGERRTVLRTLQL